MSQIVVSPNANSNPNDPSGPMCISRYWLDTVSVNAILTGEGTFDAAAAVATLHQLDERGEARREGNGAAYGEIDCL